MIPSSGSSARRYWRLNDPLFTDAAATAATKISDALEWRWQPPKNCPFPWGIRYLEPTRVIKSNGIVIGSTVYVWVPNAMLNNALSVAKKIPNIAPSLPEQDRVTAIGNMHKTFCTDRACGVVDRLADRQTDKHTQTCSLQYFARAPAGEVTSRFTQTDYRPNVIWLEWKFNGSAAGMFLQYTHSEATMAFCAVFHQKVHWWHFYIFSIIVW